MVNKKDKKVFPSREEALDGYNHRHQFYLKGTECDTNVAKPIIAPTSYWHDLVLYSYWFQWIIRFQTLLHIPLHYRVLL